MVIVTDFVRSGGAYMTINTSEGIHISQINVVQRDMLRTVDVPQMLRLDFRELNFNIDLRYDITGKKMLAQCLKSDWLTMIEFYSLLLQLVGVLDRSKEYLLSVENYLLDAEHIFIDDSLSSGTLYFTYIPLDNYEAKYTTAFAITQLVNRILPKVTNPDGSGIQKIIGICGNDTFTLQGLKEMLICLLLEEERQCEDLLEIGNVKRRQREEQTEIGDAKKRHHKIRTEIGDVKRQHGGQTKIRDMKRQSEAWTEKPHTKMQREARAEMMWNKNVQRMNGQPKQAKNPLQQENRLIRAGRTERTGSPSLSDNWIDSGMGSWQGLDQFKNSEVYDELAGGEDIVTPSAVREQHSIEQLPIKSTYIWIGYILICTVLWKYCYLDNPRQMGLYICAGGSILLFVVSLLLVAGKWSLGTLFQTRKNMDYHELVDSGDKALTKDEEYQDLYDEKWRWNKGVDPIRSTDRQYFDSGLSESYSNSKRVIDGAIDELASVSDLPLPLTGHERLSSPATIVLKELTESQSGETMKKQVYYLERLTGREEDAQNVNEFSYRMGVSL